MGTYNPKYKSTHNLLRGLRGLISAVVIGVGALDLQFGGGGGGAEDLGLGSGL